eukprot:2355890-Rhodomonas_salina.2
MSSSKPTAVPPPPPASLQARPLADRAGRCAEHEARPDSGGVRRLVGFSADDGGEGAGVCLVSPLMRGGSLEDRLFPEAEGAARRLALLMPPATLHPLAPLTWKERCGRTALLRRGASRH